MMSPVTNFPPIEDKYATSIIDPLMFFLAIRSTIADAPDCEPYTVLPINDCALGVAFNSIYFGSYHTPSDALRIFSLGL